MPVIGRRELALPRETVHQWLDQWEADDRPDLRAFFDARVAEAGLAETQVDMGDLGVLSVTDILMDDYPSYGRG